MATFSVNNKNVVTYCFVDNYEIKVLKIENFLKISPVFYTLKCAGHQSCKLSKLQNPKPVQIHLFSVTVSNDGKIVSATDANNFLYLWKFDNDSWTQAAPRPIVRKSQKIIFNNKGSEVIIADRSGDVYSFSVVNDQEKGKFLLGHISLIIDIAISSNDRYLLTSDRDGKIRISHYPNCYNILGYCLGHQEFVSIVHCINLNQEFILSSSGDGSMKLWDFSGKIIKDVNFYKTDVLLSNLEKYRIKRKENSDGHLSLPYLLDEKQVMFAVKQVSYFDKSKLCAIAFYSIKGVAVYYISDDKSISFKFAQFIPLEVIPFHVLFDDKGNLIILNKSKENQYLCFKLDVIDKICFNQCDVNSVPLAKNIEKLCGDLSNIQEHQENFETLFKRQYDDKEDIDSEKEASKKTKNN